MGFSTKLAFFLLAYSSFASASCPVQQEKLHELSDKKIGELCENSSKAQAAAESHPTSYRALRICRNSMRMARESARVIHATSERYASFNAESAPTLDQNEAQEAAARLLLSFHNYTNISLAAVYRSRLKLRKFSAQTKEAETGVSRDIEILKQETSVPSADLENPSQDPFLARKLRKKEALEGLRLNLESAGACLESLKQPLDSSFDSWARVKAELLKTRFQKFVAKGQGDEAAETQNLKDAERLQKEQQYVHDMLTDPAKRDWAYKLAEGCQQSKCDTWSTPIMALSWTAKLSGVLASTPALGTVVKVISGGLAGDLAMRQGLTFWQQVREAANGWTPFGLDFFDTEVKAIERGEARAYK